MGPEEKKSELGLSFSQREGIERVTDPMKPKYLSKDLRLELCDALTAGLEAWVSPTTRCIEGKKGVLVQRILGKYLKSPRRTVSVKCIDVYTNIESILLNHEYNKVLDFLEIFVNMFTHHYSAAAPLSNDIGNSLSSAFEKHGSRYRLEVSSFPFQFYSIMSQEQGEAIKHAFDTLSKQNQKGATNHLGQAAKFSNEKKYSIAIVESIHAVESVACAVDPRSSQTLGSALASLLKVGIIPHQALKKAIQNLWVYTNDEPGIRHAQEKIGSVNVGEEEALVMFGACASFAAYLSQRHSKLKNSKS